MYPTESEVSVAANIWAIGLIEARLKPNQIKHGLLKSVTDSKYCPDLPSFIALCKPSAEDMGFPALADAYDEACRNAHPARIDRRWSHPAILHAAEQVGGYELRNLSKDISKPLFAEAYQRTMNAVLNGETLPEIPKALEDLTSKPKPLGWKPSETDKAHGRKAMADIWDVLGKNTQESAR